MKEKESAAKPKTPDLSFRTKECLSKFENLRGFL